MSPPGVSAAVSSARALLSQHKTTPQHFNVDQILPKLRIALTCALLYCAISGIGTEV